MNRSVKLIAIIRFPGGKGQMLRFRDGMAVQKHHKSGMDLAITAVSALALHPHFANATILKLRLPTDAASEPLGEVIQQIFWRPGDPTG